MKKYEKPTAVVEMFNLEDAILASFGREETDNDLNLAL